MIGSFSCSTSPRLHFGEDKFSVLPSAIKSIGSRALVVTGARWLSSSDHGQKLWQRLHDETIEFRQYSVATEPTPSIVDAAVNEFGDFSPEVVVAIGGGSVLDAGKAISAMLPLKAGVREYLEGVGSRTHPGDKVPFIAVPTTSGTGSEATKNAVLSEVGERGFKRSLRHDRFVPDVAIVDPVLAVTCPKTVTATSGMDAFTQLLESYLSTAANPITDALALEGLRHVSRSLPLAVHDPGNLSARCGMALASYLSGITLANAGLGLVHGFASPIGGFFAIPHGVVCSALMAPSNITTVRKLRKTGRNPEALKKYAIAGSIFSKEQNRADDYYIDSFLDLLVRWTQEFEIPSLSAFGITPAHFPKIVTTTDAKNNPVEIDEDEMLEILDMQMSVTKR